MRMKYLWLVVAKENMKERQRINLHVGGAGFIRQGENNTCAEDKNGCGLTSSGGFQQTHSPLKKRTTWESACFPSSPHPKDAIRELLSLLSSCLPGSSNSDITVLCSSPGWLATKTFYKVNSKSHPRPRWEGMVSPVQVGTTKWHEIETGKAWPQQWALQAAGMPLH